MSESLASILLNSSNLLRIDLDGVNVLAPSLVTALEAVLPEKEVRNCPEYLYTSPNYSKCCTYRSVYVKLAGSIFTKNLKLKNIQFVVNSFYLKKWKGIF